MNISTKTIPQINKLIKEKKLSYLEIYEQVKERIEKYEKDIKAYITLLDENDIKSQIQNIENSKSVNETNSLLRGIPISVKDSFVTKGIRTTAASKILDDFIPPYNATAYQRLKDKGALLVGKANLDEFAHGFTTEYSAYQTTSNPWNFTKVPGGSSGGSAASVASGEALLALANQNWESIILPASLCGVVGMKPTFGRSSRYGIIAMVSSLECPGIIGRCVEDVAIGIESISGKDKKDATTVNYQVENFFSNLTNQISGLKVAVIESILREVPNEIQSNISEFTKNITRLGAKVEEIDWYDLDIDGKVYDVLYRAEVASNLARYDGIRYGYQPHDKQKFFTQSATLNDYYKEARDKFGKHVKRQILTDPITLSENSSIYNNALVVRRHNRNYIDTLFEKYDIILTPASTFTDLDIGKVNDQKWREENRKLGKIHAAMMSPTALYGYPSITFPIGFSKNNMPVGVHLFSKRFNEQVVLDIAYTYQEETGLKFLDPFM